MKVAHVISGLGTGGAEWFLFRLSEALKAKGWVPEVYALAGGGPVQEALEKAGTKTVSLGASGLLSTVGAVAALAGAWRAGPPDVVHAWMPHGNVLGLLAARAAHRRIPVVWSLHMSSFDPASIKMGTRLFARAGGWLSGAGPERIVATSEAAAAAHRRLGYAAGKMTVIPNGVDPAAFKPDPSARADFRREIGAADGDVLAACACRWHAMKDPLNLVSAAGADVPARLKVMFAGPGMDEGNPVLMEAIRATGRPERFILLGERPDMERFWAAADVAVCPSRAESFPLTVVEAMACGVPVVSTDVGDVRGVVGDAGIIVPPADPAALTAALAKVAAMEGSARRALGARARERVIARYGLEAAAARYDALYRATACAIS